MLLKAIVVEYVILAALKLDYLVVCLELFHANGAFGCFAENYVAECKLFHGPNESIVPLTYPQHF